LYAQIACSDVGKTIFVSNNWPARKRAAVVLKRREYDHASPKGRSHLRHTEAVTLR